MSHTLQGACLGTVNTVLIAHNTDYSICTDLYLYKYMLGAFDAAVSSQ